MPNLLESSNLLVKALEKCHDKVSNIRVALWSFLQDLPTRMTKRPDVIHTIQELENDDVVMVTIGRRDYQIKPLAEIEAIPLGRGQNANNNNRESENGLSEGGHRDDTQEDPELSCDNELN